jgi:Kef-type K+ transport system membrane component KefB
MFQDVMSTIEFQMSLLLFVALAGYLIAARINQSAVIGEIFCGILIGPSLLGLITYTDFVRSVAQLGAIILLFVIGLEFKMKEVFKLKYGLIALSGVIIPWIGGFLSAKLFGYNLMTSIFVGTALTATSIAITANVLREMGKLQSDAAKAIIGAAVIDDVLSLLALSVSNQIIQGTFSILTTSSVILKAAAFLVLGTYFGNTFLSKTIKKIDGTHLASKFPEVVFIYAMMVAFLYAMIAELMHLSAVVGAFVAGVALEGVCQRHGKDYKEGAEYLHIIFASIFFVSLGVLADFRELTFRIITFLISLTIVAILTKYFSCYFAARIGGMSKRDSSIIGIGMSPRGEIAMIVALIGLNEAIIKQDIYLSLVVMSLLTTIFTPIILRSWYYN